MLWWHVSLFVKLRVVRFVLVQDVINGCQEQSRNSINRFLVTPALFQGKVTVANFWIFFGFDDCQSTLNQ